MVPFTSPYSRFWVGWGPSPSIYGGRLRFEPVRSRMKPGTGGVSIGWPTAAGPRAGPHLRHGDRLGRTLGDRAGCGPHPLVLVALLWRVRAPPTGGGPLAGVPTKSAPVAAFWDLVRERSRTWAMTDPGPPRDGMHHLLGHPTDLAGHVATHGPLAVTWGHDSWQRALTASLEASGLTGRGGGGFPSALKAVRRQCTRTWGNARRQRDGGRTGERQGQGAADPGAAPGVRWRTVPCRPVPGPPDRGVHSGRPGRSRGGRAACHQ